MYFGILFAFVLSLSLSLYIYAVASSLGGLQFY